MRQINKDSRKGIAEVSAASLSREAGLPMKQKTLGQRCLSFIALLVCLFFIGSAWGQTEQTKTFESSTSWSVPTGAVITKIECWGAGGAGGFVNNDYTTSGGGGGGAYAYLNTHLSYTKCPQLYVVVGKGGSGTSGASAGGDSYVQLNNASGILYVKAGGGKGVNNNSLTGGAGGVVLAGNGNPGGKGGDGHNENLGSNDASGGGGGAAGPTVDGVSGAGGAGGNAEKNKGGVAGIGKTGIPGHSGNGGAGLNGYGNGHSGSTYGGGGSGGQCYWSDVTGGNGGDGFVRVTYIIYTPHMVHFDLNGGTGLTPNEANIRFGEVYESICGSANWTPTRPGYIFNGWLVTKNDGSSVYIGPGSHCSADEPHTAVAMWKEVSDMQDAFVCPNSMVQLSAPNGYASYHWEPASYFDNPNIQKPTLNTSLIPASGATITCTFMPNSLNNGNFDDGPVGYYTDYLYRVPAGESTLWDASDYTVTTNPHSVHSGFCEITGSSNLMVCNGSETYEDIVWEQAVKVSPNTNYSILFDAASVNPQAPAKLMCYINGQKLTQTNGNDTLLLDDITGDWKRYVANWNSGPADFATIQIVNYQTAAVGNDFAIDSLKFISGVTESDHFVVTPATFDAGAIASTGQVAQAGQMLNTIGSLEDATGGISSITYQWYRNGVAIPGATGSTYSPTDNVVGTYVYTRAATDGSCFSLTPSDNSWTVTITPELHANDDVFVREATNFTAINLDILANDLLGSDCAPFTTTFSTPAHGTVVWNATDQVAVYTPTAGYEGDDSFTYTVTCGYSTASAEVTIIATKVELACPTETAGCYAFPNATFTGIARCIQISFNEDPDACSISLPAVPADWAVEPTVDPHTSNNIAWKVTLPSTATETEIQNFIRGVSFCVPAGSTKDVSFMFDAAEAPADIYYFAGNQHYYQYVQFADTFNHTASNPDYNTTWMDCYNRAKGMTYLGRQGYLATLTSLEEDKFVTRFIHAPAWVGGTRLTGVGSDGLFYYASFKTEEESSPTSDAHWYWACGPEKGNLLMNGFVYDGSGVSFYDNQVDAHGNPIYSNWKEGEPNNSGGKESCLTILTQNSSTYTGHVGHTLYFAWNDKSYGVNFVKDSSEWSSQGYLVEYGDQVIGNSTPDVFENALQVSAKVGVVNGGVLAGAKTINVGEATDVIAATVDAEGTEPLTYQWRCNGELIAGANSATFNPSAYNSIPGVYTFTREVKDACSSTYTPTSGNYVLTVLSALTLTLNCPEETTSNCFNFPTLEVSGYVSAFSVAYTEDPEGCTITLPTLPTDWSASGNDYNQLITLPTNTPVADVQNFMRNITFCVPANTLKDVSFILFDEPTEHQIYYLDEIDHYYTYVPFEEGSTMTWLDCYEAAKSMTYLGRQGYLATLTSLKEDMFVTRLSESIAWVGATRLSPSGDDGQYYTSFDTDDQNHPETSDYWFWACGPEKGQMLFPIVKAATGGNRADYYRTIVDDAGNVIYSNWGNVEPNNGSGGESCLTVLKTSYTGWQNHTPAFAWNDRSYDANCHVHGFTEYNPRGYLVEFGDLEIGNSTADVYSNTIQANERVGNGHKVSTAELSGNATYCKGATSTTALQLAFSGTAPFHGKVTGSDGSEYIFSNVNSLHHTITVAPTATTTYTITEFSDETHISCDEVVDYLKTGSAVVTIRDEFNAGAIETAGQSICQGGTLTAIGSSAAATGGDNNISYKWKMNGTDIAGATAATYTPTVTAPGTYTFTRLAKDATCHTDWLASTGTYTVTINANPTITNVAANNPTCNGTATGTVTVTATGAAQYSINGGSTWQASNVFNGLAAGTYTVKVVSAANCESATQTVTLTDPAVLTVSVSGATFLCSTQKTSVTATAAGGTTPYTYNWSTVPSLHGSVANDMGVGTHTVTVVDANGCTASATHTIATDTEAPTITGTIASGSVTGCSPADLPAAATTVAALEGMGLSISDNIDADADLTVTSTVTHSGSYPIEFTRTYTVTDVCGNASTATQTILMDNDFTPVLASPSAEALELCASASAANNQITLTAPAGMSDYEWSAPGATVVSGGTTSDNTITLQYAAAGMQTVRFSYTNAAGCTPKNASEVALTVNKVPTISLTNPTGCPNQTSYEVTATAGNGVSPYTYAWSGVTGSTAGTAVIGRAGDNDCGHTYPYGVTVSDSRGCKAAKEGSFTLTDTEAPILNLSKSSVVLSSTDCHFRVPDLTTGEYVSGVSDNCGTPVLTQSVAAGVEITSMTTVTLTLTDGCGNAVSKDVVLKLPEAMTATVTATDAKCHGTATGSATVSPVMGGKAPYSYRWSTEPVQSGATATALTAGTYTVTITDQHGCQLVKEAVVIGEPAQLTLTVDTTKESCSGNDASMTARVSGGVLPYTYAWSTGAGHTGSEDHQTLTGLTSLGATSGMYSVTVTDANECSQSESVTIELYNPLQLGDATMPAVCSGYGFSYTPIDGENGNVLLPGTVFTWPAPTLPAGVSGGGASPAGGAEHITGTFTNEGPTPQTVTFHVTPKLGVCEGTAAGNSIKINAQTNPDVSITNFHADIPGICHNADNVIFPATLNQVNSVHTDTWYVDGVQVQQAVNQPVTVTSSSYEFDIPDADCKKDYLINFVYKDESNCEANAQAYVHVKLADWSVPADGFKTIACAGDTVRPDMATPSLMPAPVEDGCGEEIKPKYVGREVSPDPLTCEGKVVYKYEYEDCAGRKEAWSYTYSVEHTAPALLTDGVTDHATVSCIDAATAPTEVPTAADACGNDLNPTAESPTVINNFPAGSCSGTRVYRYTYADCAGKTSTWDFTYTVEDDVAPVVAATAPTTASATAEGCTYRIPDLREAVRAHASDNCTTEANDLDITQIPAAGTPVAATAAAHEEPVTVAVTDLCGNTTTHGVSVSVPAALALTVTDFGGNCHNQNDGYITVSVTGGTPGYVIDWGDTHAMAAAGSHTISGLADGSYSVKVKDGKGCMASDASHADVTLESEVNNIKIVSGTSHWTYDGATHSDHGYTVTAGADSYDGVSGTELELGNGDRLSVTIDASVTNVSEGTVSNSITSVSVTRDGEDVTCNYVVTTTLGELSIDRRPITLTSATDSKVYDGTALTNGTVTVTSGSWAAGEGVTTQVTGTQTAVGSSNNTFTYTANAGTDLNNYTIIKSEGTLTVTPSTDGITLNCPSGTSTTKKYNGEALNPAASASALDGTEVVIEYSTDGGTTWSTTVPSITHVGTQAVKVRASNANYTTATCDYTLTVNCRNITLTSGSASKEYDGTALTKTEVTIGGDGMAAGESLAYSNWASITNVGTQSNTFDYTFAAGTQSGDYCMGTITNGTLTVTASDDITLTCPTAAASTKKYDGEALSPVATAVGVGTDVITVEYSTDGGTTWSTTVPSITHVGTQAVKVRASNANYTTATCDYTLTVNCRNITLTSGSASKEYDGTALTKTEVTIGGDGMAAGESLVYSNWASITNVGTQSNTFDYTFAAGAQLTDYCMGTITNGTLTVTSSDDITLTCPTAAASTKKYDGEALSPVATAVGVGTDVITVEYSTDGGTTWSTTVPSITHVGTQTVNVRATGSNYTTATCDYTLTVNCRNITLTSGSASKEYDGTALTKTEVTIGGDGMAAGESLVYSNWASITNVGTQSNTFDYTFAAGTQSGDYCMGTITNGTLTVTANTDGINLTCPIATSTSKVYDGTPLAPVATATALGTDVITIEYSIDNVNWSTTAPSITHVGTQLVYVRASNVNYTTETCQYTLSITPVTTPVVVYITGHTMTVDYDGNNHTVTGYESTSDNPLYVVPTSFTSTNPATVTESAVGTYPMNLQSSDFSNINPDFTNVTFVVVDGWLKIVDNVAPEITCAVTTDQTVAPNTAGNLYTHAGTGWDATATDNDQVASILYTLSGATVMSTPTASLDGQVFNYGTTIVEWTATDASGNTDVCSFKVTVEDNTPPCIGCDPSNPDPTDPTAGISCATIGNQTKNTDLDAATYTHADNSWNVTATDNVAVTSLTYELSGATTTVTGANTTLNGQVFNLGTTTVTWTAKDAAGNEATCSFTVTVEDHQDPDITCPAGISGITCIDQLPAAYADYAAFAAAGGAATDNVGIVESTFRHTQVSDGNACPETITRTYYISDAAGNEASCEQVIVVNDDVAPTFTVPADVTLCRTSTGAEDLTTTLAGDVADEADNCTPAADLDATYTTTLVSGTDATDKVYKRTWTLVDNCGNETTADQQITVRPSILTPGNYDFTCPEAVNVVLHYNECEMFVNIGFPEFMNNMSGMDVTISNDAPAGNIFPQGTTVVTWTATDECGASLTCSQAVVVEFPPCGTPGDSVADANGIRYSSVRVGCQCWTGENLRTTHYMQDGTKVSNYSNYDNDPSNDEIFGKLYSWYSANKVPEGDDDTPAALTTGPTGPYVQGICPQGWALPSDADYAILFATAVTTDKLKEANTPYWLPGMGGTLPNTGFDARGAGYYDASIQRYMNLLGETYFWTSRPALHETIANSVVINFHCSDGLFQDVNKGRGQSVRCLRME